MNDTWFNTEARLKALEAATRRWLGTPWVTGSAERGVGVDCVRLCEQIYREVGALTEFAMPEARSYSSRRVVKVMAFIDALPLFERLPEGRALQAGDLLLFAEQHLHFAVKLENFRFIQAINPHGVVIGHTHDAAFMSRLVGAWFIREH